MTTEIDIAKQEGIMMPEVAKARMELLQKLKMALLTDTDIQTIKTRDGERNFIKRSGFQKLAHAFNVSDEIIKEENLSDANHTAWRIHVMATTRSGRSTIGVGTCSSKERNFAHPDHDIYATAHTRAKNRAISDIIGSGSVSAEELSPDDIKAAEKPSVDVKPDTISSYHNQIPDTIFHEYKDGKLVK